MQINKRSNKQRLQELKTRCADWDAVIANLIKCGISKRDVELGILDLIDAGLIRIEPLPGGPTAFVMTIPDGIPEEVLNHAS